MWKPRSSAALATSLVSVKQWNTPPASAPCSSAKIRRGIGGRLTRMDDQRFAGAPRGPDMDAEALTLPFQVALEAVVIQPGFADCNDPGMARKLEQQSSSGSAPASSVSGWTPPPQKCSEIARPVPIHPGKRSSVTPATSAQPTPLAFMAASNSSSRPEIWEVEVAMGIDQKGIHHAVGRRARKKCACNFQEKVIDSMGDAHFVETGLTHARPQSEATGSSFTTPFGRGQPLW
jgi:hypothetical protein